MFKAMANATANDVQSASVHEDTSEGVCSSSSDDDTRGVRNNARRSRPVDPRI
jgi:hypothetical protein